MKKLLVLATAAVIAMLASCASDYTPKEGESSPLDSPVYGPW